MKKKPPFKVGDLVMSDFLQDQTKVIYKVVSIWKAESQTGWKMEVKPVEKECPHCGLLFRSIEGSDSCDSSWFRKVEGLSV